MDFLYFVSEGEILKKNQPHKILMIIAWMVGSSTNKQFISDVFIFIIWVHVARSNNTIFKFSISLLIDGAML